VNVRTPARDAARRSCTVLLLHAPGSSAAALGPLATALHSQLDGLCEVLAVDLPGHGASDPAAGWAGAGGALAGQALQLAAAAPPAGPGPVIVLGVGSSAALAIELAGQLGSQQRGWPRVVLLEPPAWSAADVDAWLRDGLPALTPVWFGGHLLEAWHLVRDGRLFSPWFLRERAGIRQGEPDLDDLRIHREVSDLLRSNGAWQALLRDALVYRPVWPPGLEVIALDKPPGNWADVLAPEPGGEPPRS